MTQRIFNTDNEKDMADLWDILPDSVNTITKATRIWLANDQANFTTFAIKINWRGKTEIHRPIKEATEADFGKLCKFWDGYDTEVYTIGLLQEIDENDDFGRFKVQTSGWWQHCRRLTADEVKELC